MKKYSRMLSRFVLVFLVLGCTKNSEGANRFLTSTPSIKPTATSIPTAIPTVVIGDGGLITGEPCGPPCFWGIEPGKTSKVDAFQVLTQEGLINRCTVIDQFQSAIKRGAGGWSCIPMLDVTYKQSTQIVDFVRFEPTQPIMLQDIIEKHGPPDTVGILDTGLPESPSIMVTIYFSALKIALPIKGEHEGTAYEIKPTTLFHVVIYSDNPSLPEDSTTFEMAIPWSGYGSYP